MTNKLPVENAGDTDVCLFIEPYGEDFWLRPRDTVEVNPLVTPTCSAWRLSPRISSR